MELRTDYLDPKTCKHTNVICTDCTIGVKLPTEQEIQRLSENQRKLAEIRDLVRNRINSDWIPRHRIISILESNIPEEMKRDVN